MPTKYNFGSAESPYIYWSAHGKTTSILKQSIIGKNNRLNLEFKLRHVTTVMPLTFSFKNDACIFYRLQQRFSQVYVKNSVPGRGHAWQEGMHGRRVCMVGGIHGSGEYTW